MSDSPSHINFRITDRIARIELARPPLNLLTMAALRQIHEALDETLNTCGVCAVLFSAEPGARAFSVGVEPGECRRLTAWQTLEAFHDIFRLLDDLGKPVVAAVDGAVMGGGCELAAFADIVIATERATFAQPEIKVGLFPPFASVFLPQVIGPKRAAEMILTGAQISARTAAAWGLASRVVAPENLAAETEEVLQQLRAMSAASLEMARRALHLNATLDFREALQRVAKLYLEQLMSLEDAEEGVTALLEKRKPVWKDK
ncbi:MAG TPA: enoyl-CoA hydratase/isomerase family protein [Blastocatellia bacterium]|nr:enoyl-CoA hydratase/isomerase family protein [Blastocatellia bacterium]